MNVTKRLEGPCAKKMKPKRTAPIFRRNLVEWTGAKILYAACQWAMLSSLAHLAKPEDVGKFGLAFALTGPVVMFANMNLRLVQSTDADGQYQFGEYLGFRIVSQAIAFLIVILLSLLYREAAIVITFVGLAKVFESFSDLGQSYFHLHERSDIAARALAGRGILSLASLVLGVLVGGLAWGVATLALVWLIASTTLLIQVAKMESKQEPPRSIAPKFHPATLRGLATLGLPLGLMSAIGSLRTNVPRYFVELGAGYEALGYFTALSYVLIAANVVMTAVSQVAAPRLAKLIQEGAIATAKRITWGLFAIGVFGGLTMTLVCYLWGPELLMLAYGPDYQEYHLELTVIMGASVFTYLQTVGVASVAAARSFRVQPIVSMVGLFTTAIVSYWLVETHGIMGGVTAVLLGTAAEASLYVLLCSALPGGIYSRAPGVALRN